MSDTEFLDWVEHVTQRGQIVYEFTTEQFTRLRRLSGRMWSGSWYQTRVRLRLDAMRYVEDARKRMAAEVVKRLTV